MLTVVCCVAGQQCQAQFRALQTLPWYPTSQTRETAAAPAAEDKVTSTGSTALESLNRAYNNNQYSDVVNIYYPQAIAEGYQRNSALYNTTRRALRHLMSTDATDATWQQMQQLYHDRFVNVGRDQYDFRNTLETMAWCDEQLQNERTQMLAAQNDRYRECYETALRQTRNADGQVDLAVVLQGMFAPLNRAHVAHPEIGTELTEPYQEVLRWLDASEEWMERYQKADYSTYYPQTTLDAVRIECMRVIGNNQQAAEQQARQEQVEIGQDYTEAVSFYRQKQYTRAYNACLIGIRKNDAPEWHVLKSNILQSAGNDAKTAADKVAFWCASYEAGRGYVSAEVLQNLIDALNANLFMSGVAGKLHRTSSVMIITQQVWTVSQLKEK